MFVKTQGRLNVSFRNRHFRNGGFEKCDYINRCFRYRKYSQDFDDDYRLVCINQYMRGCHVRGKMTFVISGFIGIN